MDWRGERDAQDRKLNGRSAYERGVMEIDTGGLKAKKVSYYSWDTFVAEQQAKLMSHRALVGEDRGTVMALTYSTYYTNCWKSHCYGRTGTRMH